LRSRLATGPDETEAKAKAILMLFSVLASEALPEGFADVRQAAYLETVSKLPAWAVVEAARKWRDGEYLAEGENRNFVPKPAEFMRLIRIAMQPAVYELGSTTRLLEAAKARVAGHQPPTKGARERVAKLAAEFTANRGGRSAHAVFENAMSGLEKRAAANGIDFEAAMDAIPDAKPSTFRKLA